MSKIIIDLPKKTDTKVFDSLVDKILTTEEKYEQLCEVVRGDSPNWTHMEVLVRIEEAIDLTTKKENGDD
jgi:hypothetical protein